MKTPRPLRALFLSLTAVLALGAGVLPASAASPTGTDPSISAWLVVRDPTVDFGTPAAGDSGTSSGGAVTWVRVSAGYHGVNVGGISDMTGVAQSVAISNEPRICAVESWGGSALQIFVRCLDRLGVYRDTPVAMTYTHGTSGSGGLPGRLAHVWVDADWPNTSYNHVSEGGKTERVTHGTGDYTLTIPGLGRPAGSGTLLLTPYFKIDQAETPVTCNTTGWARSGANLRAAVRCRTLTGAPADGRFDLLFLRRLGPEGFGGGPAAYLRSSRKNASTAYRPDAAFAWQSNGKASSIRRTGVGVYRVTLTGLPSRGAAIVTAYGPGKARCQLGGISTTAPLRITVRCYRPNGALVNSDLTLAHPRGRPAGPAPWDPGPGIQGCCRILGFPRSHQWVPARPRDPHANGPGAAHRTTDLTRSFVGARAYPFTTPRGVRRRTGRTRDAEAAMTDSMSL